METDSLFVCTEGKKLWIKDLHLILLRKRFKKLDKYSYAIDFCKEIVWVLVFSGKSGNFIRLTNTVTKIIINIIIKTGNRNCEELTSERETL